MHFSMVDRVLERSEDRVVTVKLVSNAEEYLRDHFPSYPVLPGVMMLESMVQAGRVLLDPDDEAERPWVLGGARALKYGAFVRPGSTIRVTVTRNKTNEDGSEELRGEVHLIDAGADSQADNLPVACSGRLTLRPTNA